MSNERAPNQPTGRALAGKRADREDRSAVTRPRRQEPSTVQSEPCEDNCYAYCLSDRLDIRRLEALWLERRKAAVAAAAAAAVAAARAAVAPAAASNAVGSPGGAPRPSHEVQVVRLNKEISLLKVGRKDCFVFSFGCLVCWACTLDHANCAKEYLSEVLLDRVPEQFLDEDSILFAGRDGRPPEVRISGRDPPTFERVAVAYALAQSVRLGSLELRINNAIARTRPIPETLASKGHVELTSSEITKMIGELCVLRNQVNLHTDILDLPDIFWDYEDYEPLFLTCQQHMDVEKRVSILNQRFEVLQDLFDVLEREMNERNEHRLMWVIIILCALEALAMAFRLFIRVWKGLSGNGEEHTTTMFLPILGPIGYVFNLFKQMILGT